MVTMDIVAGVVHGPIRSDPKVRSRRMITATSVGMGIVRCRTLRPMRLWDPTMMTTTVTGVVGEIPYRRLC